jgi:hypothetical protein
MSKYKCPVCNEGFDKALFGKCPHCKTKLKKVQNNGKNGLEISYIIENPDDKPIIVPDKVDQKPVDDYEVVAQEGTMKILKNKEGNHYKVIVKNTLVYGWTYCPKCWRKLSMNMTLRGTSEDWCKHCKVLITFIYE